MNLPLKNTEYTAFDTLLQSKIQQIPIPTHLKSTILERAAHQLEHPLWEPTVQKHPFIHWIHNGCDYIRQWLWHPAFLSACASVCMLLILVFILGDSDNLMAEKTDLPRFWEAALNQSQLDTLPKLSLKSNDLEAINIFLQSNQVPTLDTLPAWIAHLPLKGCQPFHWQNKHMSLIQMGTYSDIQLFIAFLKDFPNDQPILHYISQQKGSYSLVAWNDQTQHYTLVFPTNSLEIQTIPLQKN